MTDISIAEGLKDKTVTFVKAAGWKEHQHLELRFEDGSRIIIKKGKVSANVEVDVHGVCALAFTAIDPT